ncbi:MAG: glucose-6-phosphate dehydrogenase [Desulfurivibrio sp.]|nr:glucose-6-phosphate dehydrogenase [Desulfurivibrio sp.]
MADIQDGRRKDDNGVCTLLNGADLPSCSIVIFGASGDLTARKLIPALQNLFAQRCLPPHCYIVGCGRSAMDHEEFRQSLATFQQETREDDWHTDWPEFAARIFYQPLRYDQPEDYQALATLLTRLDQEQNVAPNRIFYLAVPPSLYPTIGAQLGGAGLANAGHDAPAATEATLFATSGAATAAGSREHSPSDTPWARIVVEKPFGHDLPSAVALEKVLHGSFREEQIFRIDHYLAKETVQNILMLRFANTIFEPLWNRSYIDYVGIISAEKLGVEHRAGFYESAGVLRDMFQNHMMQLLALTAMEPPSRFEATQVQDEKVKIFRALKPLATSNLAANLVLGQYSPGQIDGRSVAGYRQEPEVAGDSTTPTFAAMRLWLDNWRWRGVPFYLVSGKRLPVKETRIVIQFKEVPHSMFNRELAADLAANRLALGIHPQEKISLNFQAKNPGTKECLQPVTMDFNYERRTGGRPRLDAYEMVLLDCILGDHMLFWRQDGIELSWAFLDPILRACEECHDPAGLLHFYPAGSPGPEAARPWLELLGG